MPPHCDAKDGPVVKGAIHALETRNVEEALRFVPDPMSFCVCWTTN